MRIRLTQLDGKLPNLALMKLSHWHKSNGDDVHFTRSIHKDIFEGDYDAVYGSCIFSSTEEKLRRFTENWPDAIVGGTGTIHDITCEDVIGSEYEKYDYSLYPEYPWSIGFTARGCRMRCQFCVVPDKEGRPRSVNTIHDIWRADTERNIALLDNDFFGQPQEQWQARCAELIDGKFKICFNQGVNIRLIDAESAEWIAKLRYYDDQFKTRRLYTAWDNLREEGLFFRGVDALESAGVPPHQLMVYMLVGWDARETMADVLRRFHAMVDRGIRPYPMVYNGDVELKKFQRWVIRRHHFFMPWEVYRGIPYVEYDSEQFSLPV